MRLILYEYKKLFFKPSTYIILLFVPLAFVLISSVFFSSMNTTELSIGVYSKDKSPLSKFTVGVVVSLFRGGTIMYVDEKYERALKNGELNAVVVIPEDFTTSLFAGKKTVLKYIPSPVNTELAAAAYIVFKQMFEDLGGGPFFNPKVLREMYTAASVPAPELITEKSLDFSQAFAPSIIFIVTMFVGVIIGSSLISYEKELGIFKHLALSKVNIPIYLILKLFVLFSISTIAGIVSYFVFYFFGLRIPFIHFLILIPINALFYSSFGLLISTLLPNSIFSNMVGSIFAIMFLFSSGTLISINQISKSLRSLITSSVIYKSTHIIRNIQFFGAGEDVTQLMIELLSFSIFLSTSIYIFIICITKAQLKPDYVP